MRILIALPDITNIETTLNFASQFSRNKSISFEVLVITDKKHLPQNNLIHQQIDRILDRPMVNLILRVGNPIREIIDEVLQGKFDFLILNDFHPSLLNNLKLHPDTISEVVVKCPCSVFIIKGDAREVKRILLCDSGAENPILSRFVLQLADLLGGEEEVTVLHVMSQISAGPGVRGKQLRADANELIQDGAPEGKLLQEDMQILCCPGIHPTAKVRHGLVLDEILAEARQGNYDLVVIGAHREHGWQRFLLEDLDKNIIDAMDRPVLVVK